MCKVNEQISLLFSFHCYLGGQAKKNNFVKFATVHLENGIHKNDAKWMLKIPFIKTEFVHFFVVTIVLYIFGLEFCLAERRFFDFLEKQLQSNERQTPFQQI